MAQPLHHSAANDHNQTVPSKMDESISAIHFGLSGMVRGDGLSVQVGTSVAGTSSVRLVLHFQ